MALSLRCKDCDTLLKSVVEAQAHNELTGHANFEETTVAVTRLVCTECGKSCRTDAEKDLHTKYTGHSAYEDKTGEAEAINTEKEFQQIKEQATEDADEGPSKVGSVEPEELVPPVVDQAFLSELRDMGFSENKAVRAIHYAGASSVEAAVNWIVEHDQDVDIDEPLLVPKSKATPKPKLSAEEAKAVAQELARKAKEKREREERELEAQRERERIRMSKEMQAAKRKEDDLALKRNYEARQREKDEAKKAKEKIRQKLEEDRLERRRKLGLPELTEEELREERERIEREEAEKEAKRLAFIKPVAVLEKLRAKLVDMKKSCGDNSEQFKTAANTLTKYLGNIARSPDEDKFRAIKLDNAAFVSRVATVPGAVDFLELVGFTRSDTLLNMPRDKVNLELLNSAGGELHNAVTNPFFGAL